MFLSRDHNQHTKFFTKLPRVTFPNVIYYYEIQHNKTKFEVTKLEFLYNPISWCVACIFIQDHWRVFQHLSSTCKLLVFFLFLVIWKSEIDTMGSNIPRYLEPCFSEVILWSDMIIHRNKSLPLDGLILHTEVFYSIPESQPFKRRYRHRYSTTIFGELKMKKIVCPKTI